MKKIVAILLMSIFCFSPLVSTQDGIIVTKQKKERRKNKQETLHTVLAQFERTNLSAIEQQYLFKQLDKHLAYNNTVDELIDLYVSAPETFTGLFFTLNTSSEHSLTTQQKIDILGGYGLSQHEQRKFFCPHCGAYSKKLSKALPYITSNQELPKALLTDKTVIVSERQNTHYVERHGLVINNCCFNVDELSAEQLLIIRAILEQKLVISHMVPGTYHFGVFTTLSSATKQILCALETQQQNMQEKTFRKLNRAGVFKLSFTTKKSHRNHVLKIVGGVLFGTLLLPGWLMMGLLNTYGAIGVAGTIASFIKGMALTPVYIFLCPFPTLPIVGFPLLLLTRALLLPFGY